MHVTTTRWERETGWNQSLSEVGHPVDFVLFFSSRELIQAENSPWRELPAFFPQAVCAGCSTAGEIADRGVIDHSITAALVGFDTTRIRTAAIGVTCSGRSREAGASLGRELAHSQLRHVIVLSAGANVNGTALTRGLRETLPEAVHVTGGLAGDGARFQKTCAVLGKEVKYDHVLAIGFYGEELEVSYGFAGGWTPFGPKRLITRSEGNILYTLDDQEALGLYKRYLGERAGGLPATGMLFPLQLLADREFQDGAVRTILGIDEEHQSLTFAGDMPAGHYVRLMRASADALIDGAGIAATNCQVDGGTSGPHLAVLVSCVGRRLVMGQRIDEEVEAALDRLGPNTRAIGFYSYGEISPGGPSIGCDLHNQTMTLTVLAEKPRK